MTDIAVSNLQTKFSIHVPVVSAVVRKAAKVLKLKTTPLSIVFVGEKRMRRLNREYLKHDYVTDVITFDHGEIIICPMVACRNAKRYGISVDREMLLYIVHGLLHLCGYDDHAPDYVKRMRQKEQQLMDMIA